MGASAVKYGISIAKDCSCMKSVLCFIVLGSMNSLEWNGQMECKVQGTTGLVMIMFGKRYVDKLVCSL